MRRLFWALFSLALLSGGAIAGVQIRVSASSGTSPTHEYFDDAIACVGGPHHSVDFCAEGQYCGYVDYHSGFVCAPGEIHTVHCGGNSFCPRGYFCSRVVRGQCARAGYKECTANAHCGADELCDGGVCIANVIETYNDYQAAASSCGKQRDYGQRYCRELSRGHTLFSSKGKEAVGCMTRCHLQAMKDNTGSCDRVDEAYARCFEECRFCQLEVSDYAFLWEVVDASDLVNGPTAAFARK